MGKIYGVGETTYDIVFKNGKPVGAHVGGSILNTVVTIGRLGLPVSFISRMGNDPIADLSSEFLVENGIDIEFITRFEGNSRLALAFLNERNDAAYSFYKAEKAPEMNFPATISDDYIVFGSTNAIRDEGRNALLLFLNQARESNALTFYDPNIREYDYKKLIDNRKKFEENLWLTSILKGSMVDFQKLYGTCDASEIFSIVEPFGVKVLLVTYGENPVELRTKDVQVTCSIDKVKSVSSIGAGDTFSAGIIHGIYERGISCNSLDHLTSDNWRELIKFAASLSAQVCVSEENYISKEFAQKCKL